MKLTSHSGSLGQSVEHLLNGSVQLGVGSGRTQHGCGRSPALLLLLKLARVLRMMFFGTESEAVRPGLLDSPFRLGHVGRRGRREAVRSPGSGGGRRSSVVMFLQDTVRKGMVLNDGTTGIGDGHVRRKERGFRGLSPRQRRLILGVGRTHGRGGRGSRVKVIPETKSKDSVGCNIRTRHSNCMHARTEQY